MEATYLGCTRVPVQGHSAFVQARRWAGEMRWRRRRLGHKPQRLHTSPPTSQNTLGGDGGCGDGGCGDGGCGDGGCGDGGCGDGGCGDGGCGDGVVSDVW